MSDQLRPIWNRIREELRRETPDFKFHTWLEPLELAGIEGRTVYIRAPDHMRTWVGERYLPLLCQAARSGLERDVVVEVVATGWRAPAEPASASKAAGPSLNPRYSFDQFVIGPSNRFAHAAALAVAELPAQAYNPLFLHGPPGLGKTHLLHAIGNYVERYGSGLRVRYATIDEFTSDFVEALRTKRTGDFKDTYRKADVVLIDDVQFLARKERTREEFFHTFNALLGAGKQLVLTSDREPEELSDLETRLIERFRSGLVVDVGPPALAMRKAILSKRAGLDAVPISDEVLQVIAETVTNSVRALEGALIQVVAYVSLTGERLTPELARRRLAKLAPLPSSARQQLAEIVQLVANEFAVDPAAIHARDRRPSVSLARQVVMYLARELTDQSLPEIGRHLGQRGHTTVLHAVNKLTADLDEDEHLAARVDNVRAGLPALRSRPKQLTQSTASAFAMDTVL